MIPIEGWREAADRFERELIERTGHSSALRPVPAIIGFFEDVCEHQEICLLHIENKSRNPTRQHVYLTVSDEELHARMTFLFIKARKSLDAR